MTIVNADHTLNYKCKSMRYCKKKKEKKRKGCTGDNIYAVIPRIKIIDNFSYIRGE